MNILKSDSDENYLINGLRFVDTQISQIKASIYTLERTLKKYEENKARIEKEIEDLREKRRKK